MIDWTRVLELRDEVGAEDMDEVVELFLEEVDGTLDRLTSAPDPDSLSADMHFLKGAALNLGFADMAAMCAQGERDAGAGNPDLVDVAAVVACYDASKLEFETGLKERVAA